MVVALLDVRYVTGQRYAAEFPASTPQPQRALGLWFARFFTSDRHCLTVFPSMQRASLE
jgi:hypothetical protein